MEIVDHALHALSDEVMVPHSGWERGNEGGEETCKPRHLEWETALTNTTGCLRYITFVYPNVYFLGIQTEWFAVAGDTGV